MKKIKVIVGLGFLSLVIWACSHLVSPDVTGVITLYAQSLPITKTVTWDANVATDDVINYTVMLDSTIVGNPTGLTQSVTFTTLGNHIISVTATNLFSTSAAGTLTVNVVIPGTPANLKIH